MMRKIITLLVGFCLIFEQSGLAQVAGPLVLPAFPESLTSADTFRPEHLRSISYEPSDNNFRTLLDKGSAKENDWLKLENSTSQLFKYFFIGLSLPNDSFWVNLRPDSPDNIIDEYLAKTDIGKVMLEADVQLKKDTAKYTNPDTLEGRAYWDKLYFKAQELFGNENITIPTLTRPWIVPDEIILRQSENNAYIYKATLKVMLEADHLKNTPEYSFNDPRLKELNDYSSQLIRDLILPELTREVNTSRRYASLRQVYFSLILAQWFKDQVAKPQKEYDLLNSKIDSRDLSGLTSQGQWTKDTYFQEYRKSFKNGEYNRQENVQTQQGISLRQYFSGGVRFNSLIQAILPGGLVKAKQAVKLSLVNTSEALIRIAYDPFKIEDITEALQPGGLLTVKGSKNLPTGASVLNSQDGGYKTITDPADLIGYAKEALKAPGVKKLKIWFDIDNTLFDHILKFKSQILYPTQDFVSQRLKQIKASMSEEEYKAGEKEILESIIKECVFWEERWLEAKMLKDIRGIAEFFLFVQEKNAQEEQIEVNLITNRFNDPELKRITIMILDSLNIKKGEQYKNIIFVGAGNGKAENIRKNIGEDEQAFFVDNNKVYVESIADQLQDLPAANVFFLDRSSHEGEFTYEELKDQAQELLARGLKNPQDRAALELFLGCAALEIAKLDRAEQAVKIAEIRNFMQGFGLDQPGIINRTYIDLCLKDIEKGIRSGRKENSAALAAGKIKDALGYVYRKEISFWGGVLPGLRSRWKDLRTPKERRYDFVTAYNGKPDMATPYDEIFRKMSELVTQKGRGQDISSEVAILRRETASDKGLGLQKRIVLSALITELCSDNPARISRGIKLIPEALSGTGYIAVGLAHAQSCFIAKRTKQREIKLPKTGKIDFVQFGKLFSIEGERKTGAMKDGDTVYLPDTILDETFIVHEIAHVISSKLRGVGADVIDERLSLLAELLIMRSNGRVLSGMIEDHEIEKEMVVHDVAAEENLVGLYEVKTGKKMVSYNPAEIKRALRGESSSEIARLAEEVIRREDLFKEKHQADDFIDEVKECIKEAADINDNFIEKAVQERVDHNASDPWFSSSEGYNVLKYLSFFHSLKAAHAGRKEDAVRLIKEAVKNYHQGNEDASRSSLEMMRMNDLSADNLSLKRLREIKETLKNETISLDLGYFAAAWIEAMENMLSAPEPGTKGENLDGGKISLETYRADIEETRSRGDIIEADTPKNEDLTGPENFGLAKINTRLFYPHGKAILEKVVLSGKLKVHSLVLGAGTGRECWGINELAERNKKESLVDTVGLTAIPTKLRLRKSPSEIKQVLVDFIQHNPGQGLDDLDEFLIQKIDYTKDLREQVNKQAVAIPLRLALDLHNRAKNYKIFEQLKKPYINKQYIGNLNSITIKETYDFIYDNIGAFFYSVKNEGFIKTLSNVLPLLSPEGVFYSESLVLEIPEWERGGVIPQGFILIFFEQQSHMLAIRKDSGHFKRIEKYLASQKELTRGVYRAKDFNSILKEWEWEDSIALDNPEGRGQQPGIGAEKDGGLIESVMISDYLKTSGVNPEALYFRNVLALRREQAVQELKRRYPKLKDNDELLGNIYDYLKLLPDNSLKITGKLSAAAERLMRSFAREPLFLDELLSWERSRAEEENILLRICMRSLMTVLFSAIEHFQRGYGLYYDQMRLIHEASLIIRTRDKSTNSDYLVDTAFLGDLKEFHATERVDPQSSALFIQVLMHEFGHNILDNIIKSRSTLIGEANVRRLGLLFWSNTSFSLKRLEEFFAEAMALKLSNELGFSSQEYVEFFKSYYEKKEDIDDSTKRHIIPRYLFFEWHETGALQNVIDGLQLSRMEESVREMIPPSADWLDIFAVEDRRLLWEFLLKLEIFRPEEYRRLKEGFNEWYNAPRNTAMAEESGESGKDGGAVQEILKQNLSSIARGEQGALGTVVDAKKAWKIFRAKDNGEVGALSREFARQIVLVDPESLDMEPEKRRESEESKIQEVINYLNEEESAYEKTGFFIFVSLQGEVQGMMRLSIYNPGKGILNRLWTIPELRQNGSGIGTILLDTFFQVLREKNANEALIPSAFEAVGFYTKYLERRGVKRQDYEVSKVDQIFNARYFTISRPSIIDISVSAKRDGGKATTGGIDLRRLPINTETQVTLPTQFISNRTEDFRLEAQWQDIRELVSKGFLPEPGRIQECFHYCQANGVLPERIESMLACLAEILRKEEDLYLPTDSTLKEFLVLLESN
jgi:hypothetical protein